LIIITPTLDNLAAYHALARQLSEDYLHHNVTLEALKTIGSALWPLLKQAGTLTPQPLIIESDAPAILALPWECLYHPELGFLGQHPQYTLSRRISKAPLQSSVCSQSGPLNILLFTAQPEKAIRLDLEVEQHTVYEALAPFIDAGKVQFYAPHDGRFNTLVKLLKRQSWDIVLLSGHGIIQAEAMKLEMSQTSCEAVTHSNKTAYFVFEGEEMEEEWITAQTLASVFKDSTVQCIVMAACQSAHFSPEHPETNLIMPLVKAGIPHLIGMREPVIDRAGSIFVRTLCTRLAEGEGIDKAVQSGRAAMTQLLATNEIWHHPPKGHDASEVQWCLPTLVSQAPTQALLNKAFIPEKPPPRQVGHQIVLPQIFIGRRRALRTLGEALDSGNLQRVLIQGKGGLGKTAFAGQLALTLAQQGYRLLIYQAGKSPHFDSILKQAFHSVNRGDNEKIESRLLSSDLEIQLKTILQEKWVFWLDHLEQLYNPEIHTLNDKVLEQTLEILSEWETPQLRILVTSRQAIPQCATYHHDILTRPNFNDFSRYLINQGLDYPLPERLDIYNILGGNFQGIQLLQSLSPSQDAKKLKKQLILVRRYLQAYLRA
jgi:hypothetical protein